MSMIASWVEGLSNDIRYVSLDDELLAQSRTVDEAALRILERTEEPRLFVGWSLGGQVAVAAASQAPEKVRGVVTVCTAPCFVERPDWSVGMAAAEFGAFQAGLERSYLKQWRRFMLLQVRGSTHELTDRRSLQRWLEAGPGTNELNLGRSLEWLGQLDQRDQWRRLKVPAVHLFAGRDCLVHPGTASVLRAEGLDCRTLPNAPHWPQGEAGRRVTHILTDVANEYASV